MAAREVTIGSKIYKLRATLGRIVDVMKKISELKVREEEKNFHVLVTALWGFIEPKFLFFKPFFSKKHLMHSIEVEEIQVLDSIIGEMMKIRVDKESKNPTASGSVATS
jgi:hypothetical protein